MDDLASKFRLIKYQFRTGRREQAYSALAALCLAAAAGLASAPKEPALGFNLGRLAQYAEYACFALATIFVAILAFRIWKQAVVGIEIDGSKTEPPAAIKGLNSFTEADGDLFAQLGRGTELQRLRAIANDDQIGICAVRGQSGAGKTSLLRAGLAFSLGSEHSIYWEAVPTTGADALLHAIASRFPTVTSLDSLPDAFPRRCVLILDQFEQLSERNPAHGSIFSLLARIAKAPAPHMLSAVVGFRRDYAPDWLDFEQHYDLRAEQIPVNLLSPSAAGQALATLASQAGFTLDQSLVDNFIKAVTTTEGVSPVDVAVGLLGLANFVQQRGVSHVNNADFTTSGGAEGLLLSFAREKLDEIPEQIRGRLLKGLVLALVNPSNDRRVGEGATAARIAEQAEVPESLLGPYLARLTHPRIRLLERCDGEHYRLPHERLVPVLRRLAGLILAGRDQVRILFEREFARWVETKSRRHLLRGKDLRNAMVLRLSLIQGESGAQRSQYLFASLRRKRWLRIASIGMVLALGVVSFFGERWGNAWIQQDRLSSWGLSPTLLEGQYAADSIDIRVHSITDVDWLRTRRTKTLTFNFEGSDLSPVRRLTGLTSLNLKLFGSQVKDFTGLEKLTGLTSLNLDLFGSQMKDLTGLEKLKHLTSLTLNLVGSQVKDLAGLEKLTGLTSLMLNLGGSQVKDLAGLEKLTGLTSLTLNLGGSQVKDFTGLEKLTGLTSLTLNPGGSQVKDFTGLEKLTGLAALTLNLGSSQVKDLAGLEKLTGLTSLTLNLGGSQVKDLTDLEKLTGLTSLTLNLVGSQVKDLTGLEGLTGLTSLTLYLGNSQVKDLTGLKLTRLTSFTLNLVGSQMKDLTGLEGLTGLTSLTLSLGNPRMKDLTALEKLTGLTSLNLYLGGSQVKDLTGLEKLTGLTSLNLYLGGSQVKDLTVLEKLTGLTSLNLNLGGSQMKDLTGLEILTGLTSLNLNLGGSLVKDLTGLEKLTGLTSLNLVLLNSQVKDLSSLGWLQRLSYLNVNAPLTVLPTFPTNSRIRRLADISVELNPSDANVTISRDFKFVSLSD